MVVLSINFAAPKGHERTQVLTQRWTVGGEKKYYSTITMRGFILMRKGKKTILDSLEAKSDLKALAQ